MQENTDILTSFKIGDKVYWKDPDDGICSGVYVLFDTICDGAILLLKNDLGSLVEAYEDEVFTIEEYENGEVDQ